MDVDDLEPANNSYEHSIFRIVQQIFQNPIERSFAELDQINDEV